MSIAIPPWAPMRPTTHLRYHRTWLHAHLLRLTYRDAAVAAAASSNETHLSPRDVPPDFVPTSRWRQLQTILAAIVGLVVAPLCVEFFRGGTHGLFDPRLMPNYATKLGRGYEMMGRAQQPRKCRAPGTDLCPVPSTSPMPRAMVAAVARAPSPGTYVCTAVCTTPVLLCQWLTYYLRLYVLAVRCVPRFGAHAISEVQRSSFSRS